MSANTMAAAPAASSANSMGAAPAAVAAVVTPPDFATADADKSGGVTFAEVQKIWPNLTLDQFSAVDANKDGTLSLDEYAVLVKSPPAP